VLDLITRRDFVKVGAITAATPASMLFADETN
jgi:hypothetical protein